MIAGRRIGSISLTREGIGLICLTGLILACALNTGANLFFLIFGLAIGLFVVAVFRSRGLLDAVEVRIDLPALIQAGRGTEGSLVVTARSTGWFRFQSAPLVARLGLYVPATPKEGQDRRVVSFRTEPLARQMISEVPVELTTTWPYHLIRRHRTMTLAVGLAVFPRLRAASRRAAPNAGDGGREDARAGVTGSLRDLRPYQAGDDRRRIHWRTSARLGDLVIRENHAEIGKRLAIIVDTSIGPGEDLEHRLEEVATELRDALIDGFDVSLQTSGRTVELNGPGALAAGLRVLAGVGAPEPVPASADAGSR